jgi:hypothetical protein
VEDRRNAFRTFIVKSMGRIPYGKPAGRKLEDDTKMNIS